jgi:probable phosphoglycerate mutase
MTRIGFVRHGSTAWNKEKRAQGSSDIPLDQDGIAEAQKLAERLRPEKWDVIYASPLSRAKQTAEIIKKTYGDIPLHFDARLRESGGGQIEGTIEQERILKWGENWRELDLGLEKREEVIERGLPAIEEIAANHPGQNVLIVSHGGFISHLLNELSPHTEMEGHLENTSLTKLIKTDGRWDCEKYNCTAHLVEAEETR